MPLPPPDPTVSSNANGFIPGVGGYDAWAAAGKPTTAPTPEQMGASPAWFSIVTKSGKVNKKTGYSPRQTAMDKFFQTLLDNAKKSVDKAQVTQEKAQRDAENAAAAAHKKAMDAIQANVEAENAIVQKNIQEGKMPAGQVPSGTPGFGTNAPFTTDQENQYQKTLKDVGKKGLPELQYEYLKTNPYSIGGHPYTPAWFGPPNAGVPDGVVPGSKEDLSKRVTGVAPPPPGFSPGPSPTTTGGLYGGGGSGPVPRGSSDLPSAGNPSNAVKLYQEWQKNQDKLDKLSKNPVWQAVLQKKHGFSLTHPSSWGEGVSNAAGYLGSGAMQDIGYAQSGFSRLGYAVNNVYGGLINGVFGGGENLDTQTANGVGPGSNNPTVQDPKTKSLWNLLTSGLSGHQVYSGQDIAKMGPVPIDIPVVTPLLGFAEELSSDPLTLTGLSTGGVIKGAQEAGSASDFVRSLLDLEPKAAAIGEEASAAGGLTRAAQIASQKELGDVMTRLVKSGADLSGRSAKMHEVAQKTFNAALESGINRGEAYGQARRAVIEYQHGVIGQEAQQAALNQMLQRNQGRVILKFAGHDVKSFQPVGKALYKAGVSVRDKAAATKAGDVVNTLFNTNYHWPGATNELLQRNIARQSVEMQDFRNQVIEQFKGLNKDEKVRVNDALENGWDLHGQLSEKGEKDLGQIADWTRDKYDKMFGEQRDIVGKYNQAQYAKNYVFHHYQKAWEKGIEDKFAAVKDVRNTRLRNNGGVDLYTLADAEKDGLKPIREADRSLIAAMSQNSRSMTKEWYNRDLVDRFGLVTDNATYAHKIGYKQVPDKYLPMIQKGAGKHVYLPPQAHDTIKATADLYKRSKYHKFLNLHDKVLQQWKFLNTAINPAHHVRNLQSDLFQNSIDGLYDPRRYVDAGKLISPYSRSGFKTKLGGIQFKGDEIMNYWNKSGANHGMFATDLTPGRFNLKQKIYTASEHREEFARLAHFLHAFDEELTNTGVKNSGDIWNAAYKAGARVNKWNINYADLTPFERSVMKRAIPFYTWFRKATPLMIKGALQHPGRMAAVDKFTRMIENSTGAKNSNDMSQFPWPNYLQNQGFTKLTGGSNPIAWTPQTALTDFNRFTRPQGRDLLGAVLGQVTPFINIPYAVRTGRDIASGAPIHSAPEAFLGDQFSILRTLEAMNPSSDVNAVQRMNRLLGLGIYSVGSKAQKSEIRRRMDALKPKQRELAAAMYPYEVHKLAKGYVVYDTRTKQQAPGVYNNKLDAIPIAIQMGQKAAGNPAVKDWISQQNS